MYEKMVARYERESTLWKNANAFYKMKDWVIMECITVDFTEEIEWIRENDVRWLENGADVTEREIARRYGKTYIIRLKNKSYYSKDFAFETRDEANEFFKGIMKDKTLKNFKRTV